MMGLILYKYITLLSQHIWFEKFFFYQVQDTTANVDSVAVVLKEIKCCSRCVLRFLGEKNSSLYQKSEEVRVSLTMQQSGEYPRLLYCQLLEGNLGSVRL